MADASMLTIEVSKHKTLLLVGSGETGYGRREICYEKDYASVLEYYGSCSLSEAYLEARNMGIESIFLLNAKTENDYFSILDVIKENDFAYIVFTDRHLSSSYNDEYNSTLVHNYFSYLLGYLGPDHLSTIIVSDKHASLYEDIDAYLEDMAKTMESFQKRCSSCANMENIIFVANNLKNSQFAEIVLAGALINSTPRDYPAGSFGEAVFDIDYFDSPGNMAFFKNHANRETTIENLVNFAEAGTPEKIVPVSTALKYVKRELDFREFMGRLYSSHIKLLFNKKLDACLRSIKGKIVSDYEILSIEAYKSAASAVTLLSRFTVTPYNCLEKCTLSKAVYLE